MPPLFDHEKLQAYQDTLLFVAWLEPILQKLPKTIAVRDQLDWAGTSIALNLAGGNGKFTPLVMHQLWMVGRAVPCPPQNETATLLPLPPTAGRGLPAHLKFPVHAMTGAEVWKITLTF